MLFVISVEDGLGPLQTYDNVYKTPSSNIKTYNKLNILLALVLDMTQVIIRQSTKNINF